MATLPYRKIGMRISELKRRMKDHNIANANQLALKIGGNRSMTWKWLNGESVITVAAAALIEKHLPMKPGK